MSEQLLNIGPLRIGAAAQRLTLRALSLVQAGTEAAEPTLRAEGLEVSSRMPLIAAENPHNARYLRTKRERAGHLHE